jgi:hypothetical protein
VLTFTINIRPRGGKLAVECAVGSGTMFSLTDDAVSMLVSDDPPGLGWAAPATKVYLAIAECVRRYFRAGETDDCFYDVTIEWIGGEFGFGARRTGGEVARG